MSKSNYKNIIFLIILFFFIIKCSLTSVKVDPYSIKQTEKLNLTLLNNNKGPIVFQRVKSADWEVGPENYTENPILNRKSLSQLKNISNKYPYLKIYPGHQSL